MGLVVNIERWSLPAAVCMATEGVRAKYNEGVGGGGFGAADREIGAKLDGAKVLIALDELPQHLKDWCLFAYASPGWNNHSNRDRLMENAANDWVLVSGLINDNYIQRRTYDKMWPLIPYIAGGLAIELSSGANTEIVRGEVWYVPNVNRSVYIELLVDGDCSAKGVDSESFRKKRRRYYQTNWAHFQKYIDSIREVFVKYNTAAENRFKKLLN